MNIKLRHFWAIMLAAVFLCLESVMAVPLKTTTSLPLTGTDITQAQKHLNSPEAVEQFIAFVKSLDVFPDHKNPTSIADIENRSIKKSFFVAPFFQASEERSTVGGQEIAEHSLTILTEITDLLKAFDFELFKVNQLEQEKTRSKKIRERLLNNLTKLKEPLTIQTTKQLIAELETKINDLDKQIENLVTQANLALDQAAPLLKKQVANQITLSLALLGMSPNREEEILLQSDNSADLSTGLRRMVARATSSGQFGYRTVVYEAGYNEQQKKWIGIYKSIRPDVSVSTLAANTVYARATAQTAKSDRIDDSSLFIGNDRIIDAPRVFLAVNGGSQGKCGNTTSCNVTIEFTYSGAIMAMTAKSGSIALPVYFEADVTFM